MSESDTKYCFAGAAAWLLPLRDVYQSGFQSGPETAPLAAVCARYYQSVSHLTAKSDMTLNLIFQKSLLLNVFPFCLKTLYIQQDLGFVTALT